MSDPGIDKALQTERVEFDPASRKKELNVAFKAIEDAAPACFMWSHRMLHGISNAIEFEPDPTGRIFGTHIVVKP